MADFITQFAADEGVSCANFNSRITQANTAITAVQGEAAAAQTTADTAVTNAATAQTAAAAAQNTADSKADRAHTHTPEQVGASAALQSSMTVYVSTGGSDSTGDGTSAKPYRTLAKAVERLPRQANGDYSATLNIVGTYTEPLNLAGFRYPIRIYGSPTIGQLTVSKGSLVILASGLTVKGNAVSTGNLVDIIQSGMLQTQGNTLTIEGTTAPNISSGVFLDSGGCLHTFIASGGLSVSMAAGTAPAVCLNGNGSAYFNNLEITVRGAAYGLRVWGGDARYNSYTFTQASGSGGVKIHTTRGGRVRTGVQEAGPYNLPLASQIGNYGTMPTYTKTEDDVVLLTGVVTGVRLNTTFATLPAGYRPVGASRNYQVTTIDASTNSGANLNIHPNGQLKISSAANTSALSKGVTLCVAFKV
ncbi:MAG: hypothetical protein ACK5L0_03290 [Candidatus Fimivivens sp.]